MSQGSASPTRRRCMRRLAQEALRPQVAVRQPIQPEDNRQEGQKLSAIEEHLKRLLLAG